MKRTKKAKRERIISKHIWFRGVEFKSQYEGTVAELLYALGIPYTYEPFSITLIDSFKYGKKTIRATTYIPDFGLQNNVVLEAKGFETPEWKIKRKLLFKHLVENDLPVVFYEVHEKKFMEEFMKFISAEYPYIKENTVKHEYDKIIKRHKLARRRANI